MFAVLRPDDPEHDLNLDHGEIGPVAVGLGTQSLDHRDQIGIGAGKIVAAIRCQQGGVQVWNRGILGVGVQLPTLPRPDGPQGLRAEAEAGRGPVDDQLLGENKIEHGGLLSGRVSDGPKHGNLFAHPAKPCYPSAMDELTELIHRYWIAYAAVGYILALLTAWRIYKMDTGDRTMYVLGTYWAVVVWVGWPVVLVLAILFGAAFLLFSGSLFVVHRGWQQARGWWHRSWRFGRFRYRRLPPPPRLLDPPVEQPFEHARRD